MSNGSDDRHRAEGEPSPGDGAPENRSTFRWGLLPPSAKHHTPTWRELIGYWFVQYNPLYFFSAMCVLAGVYLLALDLDVGAAGATSHEWALGQVLLFAVIQLYELMLVAAAGFLVAKAAALRPAVILMLLEGVFLLDCTFRLETVSHLGLLGTGLSIAWALLVPVKVWLLVKVIRARVSQMVTWLLAAGAGGLALTLQTLAMPDVDRSFIILLATWWGAGLCAIAAISRPSVSLAGRSDAASREVCRRVSIALLVLLGGVYFYHLLNYLVWIGVDDVRVISPIGGTIFLLIALLRAAEREAWIGVVFSLLTAPAFPPAALGTFILASAILLFRAHRYGNTRFAVGAILCGYLATWAYAWGTGEPPPPPVWSAAVAGCLLGYLTWTRKEPLAALALTVGISWAVVRYDLNPMLLLPQSRLGLGILLLAAGFIALTAGVWVNWRLRSPSRPAGAQADPADAPLEGSGAGG